MKNLFDTETKESTKKERKSMENSWKTFNSSQFDLLRKYNNKKKHKNSPDDECSKRKFNDKFWQQIQEINVCL